MAFVAREIGGVRHEKWPVSLPSLVNRGWAKVYYPKRTLLSHNPYYATETGENVPLRREITLKTPGNAANPPSEGRELEIVHSFREHLMADKKSKYTVKQYCLLIRAFLGWAGKEPASITAEDLEMYRRYLSIDRKYSKNSLYLSTMAIHAFFKFLKSHTADEMKAPRRGQPMPKYISEEEMKALIGAASDDPEVLAMILTLGYSGLRVGELCALDVEDVDFTDGVINVRSGKGDKGRIALIEEKTVHALKEYLDARKATTGPLFLSSHHQRINERTVQRVIKKYARKANITKKVTPHVLRHTFATTLLKQGADIRIIQQLLGHASVATTQIYTHLDDRALREAYGKAKPRY
jgi:integrase/recombinase XerD